MQVVIPNEPSNFDNEGGGEGPGANSKDSVGPSKESLSLSVKEILPEKDQGIDGNSKDKVLDKNRLVYIVMLLNGIGTLLPWNMLITAKDYFVGYKLSPEYTGKDDLEYGNHFLFYIGFVYQIPALVFNWANIFVRCGPCLDPSTESLNVRIIWGLCGEAVSFIGIIILAAVDTSKCPELFFSFVMLFVIIMSSCASIYQSSLFGIGAKLAYISPLVLGANISGTFTTVVSIISMAASPSIQAAAMFYFSTALIIIIVCLVTYLQLSKNNKFYRHELKLDKNDRLPSKASINGTDCNQQELDGASPPYLDVIKQCWVQCYNVAMVFIVTLAVFPSAHSEILPVGNKSFLGKYFVSVTCFLTFNTCAMIGNIIADFIEWPSAKNAWIPVTLRLLFIPFFLLCNYHPAGSNRNISVVFGDTVYWFGAIAFGLSSGYYSSLSLCYCSRSVEGSEQAVALAGMFGIASLVTGISLGIGLSYLMPFFV